MTRVPLTAPEKRMVLRRTSASRPSPRTWEPSSRMNSTASPGVDTRRLPVILPAQGLGLHGDPLRFGAQADRAAQRRVLALGAVHGALGAAGGDGVAGVVVLGVVHVLENGARAAAEVPHLLGAPLGHHAAVAHDGTGDASSVAW